MTKEEALKHLKYHKYWTDDSWQDEMCEMAIEALEKQIPKRWVETVEYDGDITYTCPACKEVFWLTCGTPKDNDYNYCPHCGQKLDWEEGE